MRAWREQTGSWGHPGWSFARLLRGKDKLTDIGRWESKMMVVGGLAVKGKRSEDGGARGAEWADLLQDW